MSNNNVYPISLLNDLHNWFPDVLYNPGRFRNVQDLLDYIRQAADVNPYTRGLQLYRARQTTGAFNLNRNTYIPPTTSYNPVPATTATTATTTRPATHTNNTSTTTPVPSVLFTMDGTTTQRASLNNAPITATLHTFPIMEGADISDTFLNSILNQLFTPNMNNFLSQTVEVHPTQQQISRATTLTHVEENTDDNCAICQDLMTVNQEIRQINHCRHSFHKTCIDTWFATNVHCPTCRFDIRETNEQQ